MTHYSARLQELKVVGSYPEKAIDQFEQILAKNDGLLPNEFVTNNISGHSINGILEHFGFSRMDFTIEPVNGSNDPHRKVILKKSCNNENG